MKKLWHEALKVSSLAHKPHERDHDDKRGFTGGIKMHSLFVA